MFTGVGTERELEKAGKKTKMNVIHLFFFFSVFYFFFMYFDEAWWRHEASSAAEMMEEAWKSGRQVCRLLLTMDR